MKKIMKYLLAIAGVMMLTACPSGPDPDIDPIPEPEPEPVYPQTYTQSVSVPYTEAEKTVTLDRLNNAISGITNVPSWLSVEKMEYYVGSPKIKIKHFKNPDNKTRECTITVTAVSGDKVLLTITQDAKPEGTGIDDIHNGSTDQPGY